ERIIDIEERLLADFEDGNLAGVLGRHEIPAGPICSWPEQFGARRSIAVLKPFPHSAPLLGRRTLPKSFCTIAQIGDFPQESILTVFQHPGIKNGQESHLFSLRFEESRHIESDSGALAHPAQVVGAERLSR